MEKAYNVCVWKLPDDFDSREAFEKSLYRLERDSSPGFPYQRQAPTIGEWLNFKNGVPDPFKVDLLWHDVQLVLADKWDSVIRVFVKQEPHKLAKLKDGRWRLILASSLCVQVAWQMLFQYLNDLEIEKAFDIPSQQGIVLVHGDWKRFKAQWENLHLDSGLDKSAWDWTAPFWALKLDLIFRKRLGRGRRLEEWYALAKILYRHMFEDPLILFSDGTTYRQVVPGIMKSGCVNTISTNSHCQIFLHIVVCILNAWPIHPLPVACGDDTIHHIMHTEDLETYKSLGIQVKSVSDTVEFVGHTFHENGPRPLYLGKHISNLFRQPTENLPQYLDAMARMYVHTDEFYLWERISYQLGVNLPMSREFYRHWYNYSC